MKQAGEGKRRKFSAEYKAEVVKLLSSSDKSIAAMSRERVGCVTRTPRFFRRDCSSSWEWTALDPTISRISSRRRTASPA